MREGVLICAKRKHAAADEAVRELKAHLEKKGFRVLNVTEVKGVISPKSIAHVKVGVIIGGDGTFLSLVRRLPKKDQFPLIGVNLGSLGFITEFTRHEMLRIVEDTLAGKQPEALRPLLEVDLLRNGKVVKSGTVFNDAALAKDPRTTMIKFDVSIKGEFLSQLKADGYIVSTPTGSTAYALSVGGPLLHPDSKAIELLPISSHALSARPIVVPESMPIDIEVKELNGSAFLVYDGQVTVELRAGDKIKIALAEPSLRLVRSRRQKWPQALRSKLGMT